MYLLVKYSVEPVGSAGCVGFVEFKSVECIRLLSIPLGVLSLF